MNTTDGMGERAGSVVAWDLPIRLFHWLLAALIVAAWVSYNYSEDLGDYLMKWHRWNGLAILTLLVWRILWGFAGPSTARFSSFVRTPAAAVRYGCDLLAGRHLRFLGHNPLGALMVLALLGMLLVQACLGLFTVQDSGLSAGPLYRMVSTATTKAVTHWHHFVFDRILLPLMAIHIVANLLYGVLKKEPLIPAMFTGRKPAADYEDAERHWQDQVRNPLPRALALLAVSVVLVLGGIRLVAGRLV